MYTSITKGVVDFVRRPVYNWMDTRSCFLVVFPNLVLGIRIPVTAFLRILLTDPYVMCYCKERHSIWNVFLLVHLHQDMPHHVNNKYFQISNLD